MQITGTIQSVTPAMKQDGSMDQFSTTNGQFYVFNMVINGPTGQSVGKINAKSPQYPKQAGQEISVNVTQDQQGNAKFSAFNPQYQDQAPNYQPSDYTPPPQAQPVNDVQSRIQFAQALNLVAEDRRTGGLKTGGMAQAHGVYLRILQTGQFPPSMCGQADDGPSF